jgi:ketosteroid isomerase-like protein
MEVVRALIAAANRRDIEAADALTSDAIEFDSTFAASEGRAFSGPSAIRDYFAAVEEAFDDVVIELDDVVDAEGDRVLIYVRVRGRGRGSGITVDHLYGQIYEVRDGLIVRIESFMDPQEARRIFSGEE